MDDIDYIGRICSIRDEIMLLMDDNETHWMLLSHWMGEIDFENMVLNFGDCEHVTIQVFVDSSQLECLGWCDWHCCWLGYS